MANRKSSGRDEGHERDQFRLWLFVVPLLLVAAVAVVVVRVVVVVVFVVVAAVVVVMLTVAVVAGECVFFCGIDWD